MMALWGTGQLLWISDIKDNLYCFWRRRYWHKVIDHVICRKRSMACRRWMLNIPWNHSALRTRGISPLIYSISSRWEIYVRRPPRLCPIIQEGFPSDQINTEESQISQPWQLCLLEGIKVRDQTGYLQGGEGWVYSQRQGNGPPLYDSYHRYSRGKTPYFRLKYQ